MREVIPIFLSTQSKKGEVTAFLEELKMFLEKDDAEHSTPYTLLDLDYDIEDIADRLKELTVEEYSETKIDKDDLNPPLLFVFGKKINRKLVYIKHALSQSRKRHVLCVSFHYAKDKMKFPYA